MGIKTVQSPTLEDDTATVPEAYEQLSQEAFAMWLRLHHCSDDELEAGRASLARNVFKISETRTNVLLRELRLKGYIDIEGPGPPTPSTVVLRKRCKIVGRTRFITLSRVASTRQPMAPNPPGSSMLPKRAFRDDSRSAPNANSNARGTRPRVVNEDDHWLLPVWNDDVPLQRTNEGSTRGAPSKGDADYRPHMESKSAGAHQRVDHDSEAGDPAQVWRKLAPALAEAMDLISAHGQKSEAQNPLDRPRSGIDLARMKESKERVRAKRGRADAPKHPDAGQPIDWHKLDKTGAPVISFSPTPAKREVMIRLVTTEYRRLKPRERQLRTKLLAKLRTEFVRMYTRYRRAAYLEMDRSSTYYEVDKSEYKFAEKAAIACITKGVTPLQVLRYWHKRIRNFANARMVVPPLTFLSQPSFIDEVSIAVLAGHEDATGGDTGADTGKAWKPPKRKTMWLGDTSTLHPRLRRDLMEAGFDVSKYNDSDLSVIQDYAMDVKAGSRIKLYPESLRPMIKWALENTLKGVDPKDTLWRGE